MSFRKLDIPRNNLRRIIFSLVFCFLFLGQGYSASQKEISELTKQVIEAKSDYETFLSLENVKDYYFKDHQYDGFIDFLNSLNKKKKTLTGFTNYYSALSRFDQLKFLEDSQDWNEYFSKQDIFRKELVKSAEEAVNSGGSNISLPRLLANSLLWEYRLGLQDGSAEESLALLVEAAKSFSRQNKDLAPLKITADKLSGAGEKKYARELYSLYVQGLVNSEISLPELEKLAKTFYTEKNLELSETLYDFYLEKLKGSKDPADKSKLTLAMQDLAKQFSYQPGTSFDLNYAEKIFQQLEKHSGAEALGEELKYLRSLNLEKMCEYESSAASYDLLAKTFPQGAHFEEAIFKSGILKIYLLQEIEKGKSSLAELAQKESASAWVVSSLYQLGVLAQFDNKLEEAKIFYNKLISLSVGDFQELVSLAQQRIKEIDTGASLEYNLKTFLEVALQKEQASSAGTKIFVEANPSLAKITSSIEINAQAPVIESGCTQVDLRYLWSGELGRAIASDVDAKFGTEYKYKGTKVVNLVVVSPSGIIDYGLVMIDSL